MKLIFIFQKKGQGQDFINVFTMPNMHYFDGLFFIIYVTNQTIITNSITPKLFQVTLKGMPKKSRVFFHHEMGRDICRNFFLKRSINFRKFFLRLFVKANFPRRRISRQVYAFLQHLQMKSPHLLPFPFLGDALMQEGNQFCFQEILQQPNEHTRFQNDGFSGRAQKEEFRAFWEGPQLA